MSFMRELQKSSTGRVQRKILKDGDIHILTIRRMPFGFLLIRSVIHVWEDIVEDKEHQEWNFHYLTDLFAMAKREGFFDEIAPNAPNWIGSDKFEPQPTRSSEEEEWEGEEWDDSAVHSLDDNPKHDWYEGSWGEDEWEEYRDEDNNEDTSDWDFSPPF